MSVGLANLYQPAVFEAVLLFRLTTQHIDEGIDAFIQRLRLAAVACEYDDTLERELRIQLATGCKHEEVRETAIYTPASLADLIAHAMELETPAVSSDPESSSATETEPFQQHQHTNQAKPGNNVISFGSPKHDSLLPRSGEGTIFTTTFGSPKRNHFLDSGPDQHKFHNDCSFGDDVRASRLLGYASPASNFVCECPLLPASRGPDSSMIERHDKSRMKQI